MDAPTWVKITAISDRNKRNGFNVDPNRAGRGGNGLPCWYHENRTCQSGQRCRQYTNSYMKHGEITVNVEKTPVIYCTRNCRKFFSLGYGDKYSCLYIHTLKRWHRDPVSSSTGSTQGNNWNSSGPHGHQNDYQNYYTYGQGSHLNEEDIYNYQITKIITMPTEVIELTHETA